MKRAIKMVMSHSTKRRRTVNRSQEYAKMGGFPFVHRRPPLPSSHMHRHTLRDAFPPLFVYSSLAGPRFILPDHIVDTFVRRASPARFHLACA